MIDFASSAMVRVMSQGLRELGLPPLEPHNANVIHGYAKVDLDQKLLVVQHALKHGGVGCLVHLGRGIHYYSNEPTHRAMVSAREPIELVERWQRLERYIHSRHRLRITARSERRLEIAHCGVRNGIYPSLYESLVVLGVIAALLEARGVRGLEIYLGIVKVFPATPKGFLEKLPAFDPIRCWTLSWKECVEPLALASNVRDADDIYSCSEWPIWQRKLTNLILERLFDTPTLKGAATYLNVSSRTLQRDLKQLDLSFSKLVSDCRARIAAKHLIESNIPLAGIGYLCGYSDQAHFTREFGKRVGMPPEKYRVAFQIS